MDLVQRLVLLLLICCFGSADAACTRKLEIDSDEGTYYSDGGAGNWLKICVRDHGAGAIPAGPPVWFFDEPTGTGSDSCGRWINGQWTPLGHYYLMHPVWIAPNGQKAGDLGPNDPICSAPANDCPSAGTVEGDASNAYESVGVATKSLCIGTCEWTGGSVVPSVCANGKCYTFGPFTATGKTCDPNAPPSGGTPKADETASQDAKCVSSGGCPGTINGTFRCVPCNTKSQTTETKSSSSSSSAASGASSPSSSSQESGTTSKTTTCEGSQCTTTTKTTTVNPDGSTTEKTDTKTEAQTDFCASNPKAAVCKGVDDSKWGGSCTGGFTCSGDAVQCAQAQAAYDLSCAAKTDPSNATVQAGAGALAAGDRPPGHPGLDESVVDLDLSSRLDSTPLFGSSSDCPSDVSFDAQGHQITIPFSSLCPYLRMLGALLMAGSYLAAAFIVFKD